MKKMKRLVALFLAVFMVAASSMTAFAAEGFDPQAQSRVMDTAHLLSVSETRSLVSKLDSISKKHNVDVTLVTYDSMPTGYSKMEKLADDTYEGANYGYGSAHDGVILVICMDPSKWQISTEGYGLKAFTDAGIQYIGKQITPLLKEKKYEEAFSKYADLADDFITQAKAGKAYDKKNLPKDSFNVVKALGISAAIGIVIALIVFGVLSAQLKSVRQQYTADFYTKEGSMKLNSQSDVFLFRNVSRTKRESSNGGSSSHLSSSGRSHGGGGGSF